MLSIILVDRNKDNELHTYLYIPSLPYILTMTNSLATLQSNIQQKRKDISFKDFIKEIASRRPMTFYKHEWWISRYPQTDRVSNLVSTDQYEHQREEFLTKWKERNDEVSFFDQFSELFASLPKERCFQMAAWENTQYADVVRWSKDVYLSNFVVIWCENVLYSMWCREDCTNVLNSLMVYTGSENVYQSVWVITSYNVFYSKYLSGCSDIWFSQNMQWCTHCIACHDLQNKSYCIQNKQYTKEEYLSKKQSFMKKTEKFDEWFASLSKPWFNLWSWEDVSWTFVVESQNTSDSLLSYNLTDCKNVVLWGWDDGDTNMNDVFIWWAVFSNDVYAVHGTAESEHVYCSTLIIKSSQIYYSWGCESCSYCFGCIWLRNASYCILNKQYSKEERHRIVDEISTQMKNEWVLWDFFPSSMNPFYYNDTAAYLIDDTVDKDDIKNEWFLWRDEVISIDIPAWIETISSRNLCDFEFLSENWLLEIDPDILKKVIQDDSWNMYRIIPKEIKFLKKYWLPLPRKHWLERLKDNFNM